MNQHLTDPMFEQNIGRCVALASALIARALTEKQGEIGKIQMRSIWEG